MKALALTDGEIFMQLHPSVQITIIVAVAAVIIAIYWTVLR